MGGVVCKVIFMSNPTFVELLLSWHWVGVLTIFLSVKPLSLFSLISAKKKTHEQKEYLLDTKFSEKYLKENKYPLNDISDWNCLFDEVHLNGSHGAGRSNTLRAVCALEGCRSSPGSAIPSTASTTAINSDHYDVTDFRPMREEHRFSRPIE